MARQRSPSRPVVDCSGDPVITVQSEADAVDVNKIVARFEKTGLLPQLERQQLFVDVSVLPDYRTVQDQIATVREYFMSLPAKVRARFENDPAVLLDFMADAENGPEARRLGLLPAEPVSVASSVPPEPPKAA